MAYNSSLFNKQVVEPATMIDRETVTATLDDYRPDPNDAMFEVLNEPTPAVVAIRVGDCSPAGFRDLYRLLSATTDAHDTVHLYEETVDWTARSALSNWYGILPDLRRGSTFDIGRYAAVGDSVWARGLFDCWRAIAPVWPVSPDEMRYFGPAEREAARSWVRTGELPGDRGRATQ